MYSLPGDVIRTPVTPTRTSPNKEPGNGSLNGHNVDTDSDGGKAGRHEKNGSDDTSGRSEMNDTDKTMTTTTSTTPPDSRDSPYRRKDSPRRHDSPRKRDSPSRRRGSPGPVRSSYSQRTREKERIERRPLDRRDLRDRDIDRDLSKSLEKDRAKKDRDYDKERPKDREPVKDDDEGRKTESDLRAQLMRYRQEKDQELYGMIILKRR